LITASFLVFSPVAPFATAYNKYQKAIEKIVQSLGASKWTNNQITVKKSLTRARCRAAAAVLLEASADFASASSALARVLSAAMVSTSASGVVNSSCFVVSKNFNEAEGIIHQVHV
jgi:hypothetical protein